MIDSNTIYKSSKHIDKKLINLYVSFNIDLKNSISNVNST